jgi:hypothetical protein
MTFPTTGREQAGLDAPTGVVTCTARHKAYPWTCTLPKGHQGDHRDTEAEAPQGHVLVWGRQSTRDGYPMGQRLDWRTPGWTGSSRNWDAKWPPGT